MVELETVCPARIVYNEKFGSESVRRLDHAPSPSRYQLNWERWLSSNPDQDNCCVIEESGIKELPKVTVLPKGGKDMEFKSVGMSVAAGVTLGDVNYMAVPLVLHTGSSRRVILVSFRGTATYVPVSP
jgi:hypothetical protein